MESSALGRLSRNDIFQIFISLTHCLVSLLRWAPPPLLSRTNWLRMHIIKWFNQWEKKIQNTASGCIQWPSVAQRRAFKRNAACNSIFVASLIHRNAIIQALSPCSVVDANILAGFSGCRFIVVCSRGVCHSPGRSRSEVSSVYRSLIFLHHSL